MIFTRLQIENLASYEGIHVFELSPSSSIRKIVLLGGKNGAGKTTLFQAIRLALYGPQAYGLSSKGRKYTAHLRNLINQKEQHKVSGNASVRISLRLDDGQHPMGVYSIERRWILNESEIEEVILYNFLPDGYHMNERQLNAAEQDEFEASIHKYLPISLFNFYFFDGENLTDFFKDGKGFKDTLLSLTGLENFDILVRFLRELSLEKVVKKNASAKYKLLKERYFNIKKQQEEVAAKVSLYKEKYESITAKIESDTKSFFRSGGISEKEEKYLQDVIVKETQRREKKRLELKEFANGSLPILLMKKQIKKALSKLDYSADNFAKETIFSYFEKSSVKEDLIKIIGGQTYDLLLSYFHDYSKEGPEPIFYSLSSLDKEKIREQTSHAFSLDTGRYIALEEEITSSSKTQKELRNTLSSASKERTIMFEKNMRKLNKEQASIHQKLLAEQERYSLISSEYEKIQKDFLSAEKECSRELREKSSKELFFRMYNSFSEYEIHLFREQVHYLREAFLKLFNSIINKKNLISGLEIDNELRVYPYRKTTCSTKSMRHILDEIGKNEFIRVYGQLAFDELQDEELKEKAELSLKMDENLFSKGEWQVYLMCLYGALSSLGERPMPFVIDTPFGRIDTQHRKSLIENLMIKLHGQVIVLSTDEEINQLTLNILKPYLARTYTLVNNGVNGTTLRENEYFGEVVRYGE